MGDLFTGARSYCPQKDGSLLDYLENCRSSGRDPLFHGIEPLREAFQSGLVRPGFTLIRLMWNFGRTDEHYVIRSRDHLEGILLAAHSGRPGIHPIEDIVNDDAPKWELIDWNPVHRVREIQASLNRLHEALDALLKPAHDSIRLYRGGFPGELKFSQTQLKEVQNEGERANADLIGRWYTFSIECALNNLFEHDRDGVPRELKYLDVKLDQARLHYSLNRGKKADDLEGLQELEFILPIEDVVSSKVAYNFTSEDSVALEDAAQTRLGIFERFDYDFVCPHTRGILKIHTPLELLRLPEI